MDILSKIYLSILNEDVDEKTIPATNPEFKEFDNGRRHQSITKKLMLSNNIRSVIYNVYLIDHCVRAVQKRCNDGTVIMHGLAFLPLTKTQFFKCVYKVLENFVSLYKDSIPTMIAHMPDDNRGHRFFAICTNTSDEKKTKYKLAFSVFPAADDGANKFRTKPFDLSKMVDINLLTMFIPEEYSLNTTVTHTEAGAVIPTIKLPDVTFEEREHTKLSNVFYVSF